VSHEPVQTTRIKQELLEDDRVKYRTSDGYDGWGATFSIGAPADADADLAGTRDRLDAWYVRLKPLLSASDWVKLQLDIAALETDRWHATATRVVAAVFDEGREQPNVIIRRTLPGDRDAVISRRHPAAVLRRRGRRIILGALALCLSSPCLGFGAAAAGRRGRS